MGGNGRFVRVLVAGAVVAGLAGCGGAGPPGQVLTAASPDPSSSITTKPNAEPTVSARPTVTVTAVSEPGELPEAAGEHTPKGAEAFVRYWVAAANAAFASGEIGVWRELNAPSCKSCAARIADVEAAYGSGGRIEGGQLEILSIVGSPLEPGTIPQVIVEFAVTPERDIHGDGRLLRDDPGGNITLVFLMEWNKPGWSVAEGKAGVRE